MKEILGCVDIPNLYLSWKVRNPKFIIYRNTLMKSVFFWWISPKQVSVWFFFFFSSMAESNIKNGHAPFTFENSLPLYTLMHYSFGNSKVKRFFLSLYWSFVSLQKTKKHLMQFFFFWCLKSVECHWILKLHF